MFFLLLIQCAAFAQVPGHGINYQAIARDTAGLPIANTSLDIRFTIYNDSSGISTTPFSELQNRVTNIYGLFTALIGQIDSTEFANINWSNGKKFLEVEIAQAGSSTFFSMGINPLVSVPYALYSKNSANTWRLNGNRNATNFFIGTTDTTAFTIKTNNLERIKILANGYTGIGTPTPYALLDIKGIGDIATSYAFGIRNSQDIYSVAVRDDGYIGLGTVLPNARLDIKGKGNNNLSYSLGVSDSTGTYAFVVRDDRRTGIGTVDPQSLLSVGPTSGFQVNDSGTVVSATGITSSGAVNLSSLSTDGIVRATGGTGTLSSSGGNIDLTSEITGILPVANGGTGLSSLGNWQTFYSDGSGALTPITMGISGTFLQSNGPSFAPTWATPSLTLQTLSQGTGISTFSYDGTAPITVDIANTGVTTGSYGGGISGQTITIPDFTVNAQGQLTSASSSSYTIGSFLNATNGLSSAGDSVILGGQLIQHTDIKTKEHNISFTLDSTGYFTIDKNGGQTALFVEPSNGNIGIGTTSPLGKLQVDYDTTIDFSSGPGLNSYGSIHIVPDKNIGDNSMAITFGSPDEVAGSIRTTVQAGMYVQGSGNYGTKMYFATTDDFNTAGAKTRMLIDPKGRVGIGTITPTYTVDIKADTGTFQVQSNSPGEIATIRATNDAGNAKFVVESATGGTCYTGSTPYSAVIGTDYQRSLHFATASTVMATILRTGEFGIGTVNPASMFAVKGGMSIGSSYSDSLAPTDGAVIEGNVGIGTFSPVSMLDVAGGVSIGTSYAGSAVAPTNGAIVEGSVGIGNSSPLSMLDVAGGVSIGSAYAGTVVAPTSGAIIEGSVGIGTSSPLSALDVYGGVSIGKSYAGAIAAPSNGAIIFGNVGIGNSNPLSMLDVTGGVSIGTSYAATVVAPANGAIIEGNVGIGTSTPGTSLEVNGGITLSPLEVKSLADGDTLSPGNVSYIRMHATSNVTLAAIGPGMRIGQLLILENVDVTGNGKIKIPDNAGTQLSGGDFDMQPSDTLTLIWNGTNWLETSNSTN